MAEEKKEPNITRIVRSSEEPNVWRCSLAVDFTTPEGQEALRKLNSPEGMRRWLTAAIGNYWIALAEHHRNGAVLVREMRNLLDLTVENLHAHPQAFGIEGAPVDLTAEEFRHDKFLGPSASLMLHLAAETCGRMLPAQQQNVTGIERELRAHFEQVLAEWLSNPPDMLV